MGQSASDAKTQPQTRKAFLATLRSYHRSGGGRFLVYFDGDDPNRSAAPPGISVRYSAPDSTDEAILRRLQEIQLPSEVIVVTNDRQLRNRCRNAGSSVMNWSQFTSKMKSRSARAHTPCDSQERVDVEDWMRYFGLDK